MFSVGSFPIIALLTLNNASLLRYGPGRQSRQQWLGRLNQLQTSIIGWEGKEGCQMFLIFHRLYLSTSLSLSCSSFKSYTITRPYICLSLSFTRHLQIIVDWLGGQGRIAKCFWFFIAYISPPLSLCLVLLLNLTLLPVHISVSRFLSRVIFRSLLAGLPNVLSNCF